MTIATAIVFAGLTFMVAALLLAPLLRAGAGSPALASEQERAIYRDQLAELERDRERGLIAEAEAEAARNEISRRLLQTADVHAAPEPASTGKALPVLAVLLVPLVALPIYATHGNPGLPDVPLAERMQAAAKNEDLPALVRQLELHLEKKPDDLKGWQMLAGVYKSERRWAEAAGAFANVVRLAKPDAMLLTDYADMLMLANEGVINDQGQAALKQALALDPANPKARFFAALALKQEGKHDEAKAQLAALLAAAPADAPWRKTVEDELNTLSASKAPALSEEQMAAASQMNAEDKAAMITSMIDGLEQKLGATSTDLAGWLRLIRARSVNAEPAKAQASLATARQVFKDNAQALAELGGLAKELGLEQ